MSAGLMVWDQNGNVRVDMTRRYCRFFGSIRVSQNGSINIPELAQGMPFFVITPVGSLGIHGKKPVVTVSGTVMSYQYLWVQTGGDYSATVDIYYGVY